MNPPNPLTIEWLRENAKIGETVLVDEEEKEFIITALGETVFILKNLKHKNESAWTNNSLDDFNFTIKQPEPVKKPKACAFVHTDGSLIFAVYESQMFKYLKEKGRSFVHNELYDIEAREEK